MANIQRTQVLVVMIISLLIQISLLQAETIASDVHPNISTLKSMVRITNRLGDGSTLNLHCKSSDDNLGLQILAPNKSWSFTFRPNIWGTTNYRIADTVIQHWNLDALSRISSSLGHAKSQKCYDEPTGHTEPCI
ncbi:hypothetical protein YC2023_026778 [Brassica napus]